MANIAAMRSFAGSQSIAAILNLKWTSTFMRRSGHHSRKE
jgi:hypothetical protein